MDSEKLPSFEARPILSSDALSSVAYATEAALAVLILVCRGDTTVAVNLYALGVFSAFTLSQAGMVVRWLRQRARGWQGRLLMNALGSLTTCVVLLVIVVSKFDEGALARIRHRYDTVCRAISLCPGEDVTLRLPSRRDPVGNTSLKALRYADTVSDRMMAVWVLAEGDAPRAIREQWRRWVGEQDGQGFELRLLESPYASLIDLFVAFVAEEEQRHLETTFTIVMPMAIPRYRFDALLLNQRA